jgi:hypothetical protein
MKASIPPLAGLEPSLTFLHYSLPAGFSLAPSVTGTLGPFFSLTKGGREGVFEFPTPSRGGEKEGNGNFLLSFSAYVELVR